jgi:hypothetical protein
MTVEIILPDVLRNIVMIIVKGAVVWSSNVQERNNYVNYSTEKIVQLQ